MSLHQLQRSADGTSGAARGAGLRRQACAVVYDQFQTAMTSKSLALTGRAVRPLGTFYSRSRRGPLNRSRRQPAGILLPVLSAATLVPGAAHHAFHHVTEPLPVVVSLTHEAPPSRQHQYGVKEPNSWKSQPAGTAT